jgi:crotonobetainyl-CoA:carnitine CoA-transferase CaiB-like acyl-CoA transferase
MGAFIAGPYCGQLLADFGADVIKVEPPGDGDPMRKWGLHKVEGRSLWWPVIGRNKRSITLDLRKSKGQALARRLLLSADVLVENFRPGAMEKWNLDPEGLRKENPKLIVARVSGFGQTGPYRDRAGFGAVAEAMGGLRFLTGYPDRPPTRVGLSIGDSLAGLFAAFGVANALYARDARPGAVGQTVDAAITDSVLAVLESVISEYSLTNEIRQRSGDRYFPELPLPISIPLTTDHGSSSEQMLTGFSAGSLKQWAAMHWPSITVTPRTRLAAGIRKNWTGSSPRGRPHTRATSCFPFWLDQAFHPDQFATPPKLPPIHTIVSARPLSMWSGMIAGRFPCRV